MIWAGEFLFWLLLPVLCAVMWTVVGIAFGSGSWRRTFPLSWLGSAAGGAVPLLLGGKGAGATGASVSLLLALACLWWTRRKGRKRALRALGHKARARIAAMLRSMPKPGPVLRPVPQGARA